MNTFTAIAAAILICVLAVLLIPVTRRKRFDADSWKGASERDLNDLEQGKVPVGEYCERRRVADLAIGEVLAMSANEVGRRRVAAIVVTFVVGGSTAVYMGLARQGKEGGQVAAFVEAPAHAQNGPQLDDLASRLAARLAKSPDDLQGWEMLGRTYTTLRRFAEANEAYARAADRPDPGAALLADYADAMVASRDGHFDAASESLVARALQVDPHEHKALSLAGTIAYDKGDYPTAIAHWTVLAGLLPAGSPRRLGIEGSLNDARAAGNRSAVADQAGLPDKAGVKVAAVIAGVIRLDPRFSARLEPSDTLLVYARPAGATQGPPVAAKKLPARFPAAFVLSDEDAMVAGSRLSETGRMTVSARLSRDGSATPQSGDPFGQVSEVAPGTRDLDVLIDTARP